MARLYYAGFYSYRQTSGSITLHSMSMTRCIYWTNPIARGSTLIAIEACGQLIGNCPVGSIDSVCTNNKCPHDKLHREYRLQQLKYAINNAYQRQLIKFYFSSARSPTLWYAAHSPWVGWMLHTRDGRVLWALHENETTSHFSNIFDYIDYNKALTLNSRDDEYHFVPYQYIFNICLISIFNISDE